MRFLFLVLTLLISNTAIASLHKTSNWDRYLPQVVVCNGADIDVKMLKKAMHRWIDRGEKINHHIDFKDCNTRPEKGEIAIYSDDGSVIPNRFAGYTQNSVFKGTDEIAYSRVWVLKDSDYQSNLTLLEHEIGHALGYGHSDDADSIMWENRRPD